MTARRAAPAPQSGRPCPPRPRAPPAAAAAAADAEDHRRQPAGAAGIAARATSTPRSWPGCARRPAARAGPPATPRAWPPPAGVVAGPSARPRNGWPPSRSAGSAGSPRRPPPSARPPSAWTRPPRRSPTSSATASSDSVLDAGRRPARPGAGARRRPGLDALRRALTLVPRRRPGASSGCTPTTWPRCRPRRSPSCPDGGRAWRRPTVERAGAVAEAGTQRVDAQLSAALERVRQVLRS